eukprot:g25511.t1
MVGKLHADTVNAPDLQGHRPLHQAVLKKRQEVVAELLRFNADVDARKAETSGLEVHVERSSLHQVWGIRWHPEYLRRQRHILEHVVDDTPLGRWNEEQRAQGREILQPGAELVDVNGQAGAGAQSVLRNAKKVHLLFRQGDPLIGDSVIHLAVRQGDALLLSQLLMAKGDQYALGAHGETAYELAKGQPEILELLTTFGEDKAMRSLSRQVSYETEDLRASRSVREAQSLRFAAEQGDVEQVESLIKALADVDGRCGTHKLHLELLRAPGQELWGFSWKDHPKRRILEEINPEDSPAASWNRQQASWGGETLRRGDELVEVNGHRGWSQISQLRRWHQVDLVFHLAFMTTPLVAAASHGHVEVVKLLLAARADPHLHWEGTRVALELQRPSLMTPWGFKWDQRFDAWH